MDIYFRVSAQASLLLWLHLPLRVAAEHRCFYGFTPSSTVCLSVAAFVASPSSSSVCPSIAAFMASLPLRPSARASLLLWLHFLFDPLPEHRCFYGFTFLFDPLPEHRCFYGFTFSSTLCPSIAAFMALLPLRPSARASLLLWLYFRFVRLPEHRCFCGFTFLFDRLPEQRLPIFAAVVVSLSPLGVLPLITRSNFGGTTLLSIVVSGQLCHGHDCHGQVTWGVFRSTLFQLRP